MAEATETKVKPGGTVTTNGNAANTGTNDGDTKAADPLVDPLVGSAGPDTTQNPGGGNGGGKDAPDAGKLTWEAALGKFLGGKLYSAIAPQLADAKLSEYANSAWQKGIDAVVELVKSSTKPSEAEIAKKLTEILKKELPGKAGEILKATNLGESLRDFVDGNPYLVVLAALAGAVAFVATNQPIPAVKQQIGVGSGKLLIGAKFDGGALDLVKAFKDTVSQLELGYSWSGGEVKAGYEKTKEGMKLNGSAGLKVQDSYKDENGKDVKFDRFAANANGNVDVKNGKVDGWKAGGDMKLALGDKGKDSLVASGAAGMTTKNGKQYNGQEFNLGYKNDNGFNANAGGQFVQGPGLNTTKLNLGLGYQNGGFSTTGSLLYNKDANGAFGQFDATAGYKGDRGGISGNAMLDTRGQYKFGVQGDYKLNDNWKMFGQGEASRMLDPNGTFQNKQSIGGGVMYEKGDNFLKFGGEYNNVNGQGSGQLGVQAGFRF